MNEAEIRRSTLAALEGLRENRKKFHDKLSKLNRKFLRDELDEAIYRDLKEKYSREIETLSREIAELELLLEK